MSGLAVIALVAAVLVWPRRRAAQVAERLRQLGLGAPWRPDEDSGRAPAGPPATPRTSMRRRLLGPVVAVAGFAAVLLTLGVLAAILAGAVLVAPVWWQRRTARRRARAREHACRQACLVIAGELAAGASADRALGVAGSQWPELLGSTAGRSAIGGDVVVELRRAASRPGAGALRAVAAGWEVAERSGAGLADVLTVVADTLRTEEAIRREAESALSGVRVTARTLALLPVLTLLSTTAGGARPWEFLLGTAAGTACLVIALLLVLAGSGWVSATAKAATRSRWETG